MRYMEHIVAATGLGPASRAIVETATRLAELTGAQVHLTYAVPPMIGIPRHQEQVADHARVQLERLGEELQGQGVVASGHVEQGEPGPAVCAVALRTQADLLVVGCVGDGGLGSVAEHCLLRAPCSVWVARPGVRPLRTIVVGLDTSEPSVRALESAVLLARRSRSRLVAVHALQPLSTWLGGLSSLLPQDAEARRLSDARSELQGFLEQVDLAGVEWELSVVTGRPQDELPAAMERLRADLLVVGARSRRLLGATGSVARRVAASTRGAVLVVRERSALRPRLDVAEEATDKVRQGRELLDQGQPWEALQILRLAVEQAPTLIPAWHALALAQRALEREADAQRSEDRIRALYQAVWSRAVEADIRRIHGMGRPQRPDPTKGREEL